MFIQPYGATIGAAGTISTTVTISNEVLVGLIVAAGFTTADITLNGSIDGVTFYPIFDQTGTQIKIVAGQASRGYSFNSAAIVWPRFVQFVTSVAQAGGAVLTAITKDF